MNIFKTFPQIRDIWNKLNQKQKKFLLATLLSVSTLGVLGCSDKDATQAVAGAGSTIDDKDLEETIKKYSFHAEQVECIIVKEGDTLTDIASEHGMTVDEIVEINAIENPDFITPGMTLIVLANKTSFRTEYDSANFTDKIENQGYTKGIDISSVGQKNIDLEKVLYENNIDFVIARMAYFISQSTQDANRDGIDDAFDSYAEACAKTNTPMGVYFWPSVVDVESAKKEVDIITNKLEEIKEKYGLCLELPLCLDIELATDGGGKVVERLASGDQDSIDALEYMVNTLEEKGYFVMIYTGNNCLRSNANYRKVIEALDVDTWIPRYSDNSSVHFSNEPEVLEELSYDGKTSIRQYSKNGRVNGYNGEVDLNVCYTDFPKIIKENGLNGFAKDNTNALG